MYKSSYGDVLQHGTETESGLRESAVGVIECLTPVLPQSDPCSVHRLHRYAHETRSKDPG